MFLRQLYHDGLAQASYLIGCQATGEALVIDPNRNIEQYLTAAQRAGLRITAVTETHIHADYVSGARELAARTGAQLYVSDMGRPSGSTPTQPRLTQRCCTTALRQLHQGVYVTTGADRQSTVEATRAHLLPGHADRRGRRAGGVSLLSACIQRSASC
jgi:glyoxylase-like metal-dependent hydrolase (beta-lactamase superfamily II)